MIKCAYGSLVIACCVAGAAPGQPGASGHAVLRGIVVQDLGQRPVAMARVTVSGGGLKEPLVFHADERGTFAVPGLADGRYHLAAERAGFFPLAYGEVVVTGTGELELGALVLTARRKIAGTVHWRSGEPGAGAQVFALRIRAGRFAAAPGYFRGAHANDQGSFEIQGLHPGRYVVCAMSPAAPHPEAVPGAKSRWASPVYYPGPNPESALDLLHADEVSGLSLALDEAAGVEVEGVVLSSPEAAPGQRIVVGLLPPGSPLPFVALTFSTAGGRFRFSGVPPGEYLLIGSVHDESIRGFLRGIQPVRVREEPLRELEVPWPGRAPIRGKVEIEEEVAANVPGGPPLTRRTPGAGVSIQFESERLMLAGFSSVTTDESGRFAAANTAAGEVFHCILRRQPPETYLAAIEQGGRDLTNGPALVTASGDEVHILLKKNGGRIEGLVEDKPAPAARAFVVLAPKDRRLTHRFRTVLTDRAGAFSMRGVAPGDYDLLALDQNDSDEYLRPEYLAKYSSRLKTIAVGANGVVSSVRIELSKASKP